MYGIFAAGFVTRPLGALLKAPLLKSSVYSLFTHVPSGKISRGVESDVVTWACEWGGKECGMIQVVHEGKVTQVQ